VKLDQLITRGHHFAARLKRGNISTLWDFTPKKQMLNPCPNPRKTSAYNGILCILYLFGVNCPPNGSSRPNLQVRWHIGLHGFPLALQPPVICLTGAAPVAPQAAADHILRGPSGSGGHRGRGLQHRTPGHGACFEHLVFQLASGKHTKNYGKSPFSMVNPL